MTGTRWRSVGLFAELIVGHHASAPLPLASPRRCRQSSLCSLVPVINHVLFDCVSSVNHAIVHLYASRSLKCCFRPQGHALSRKWSRSSRVFLCPLFGSLCTSSRSRTYQHAFRVDYSLDKRHRQRHHRYHSLLHRIGKELMEHGTLSCCKSANRLRPYGS